MATRKSTKFKTTPDLQLKLGDVVRLHHSPGVWMTVASEPILENKTVSCIWFNKADYSVHQSQFHKKMLAKVPDKALAAVEQRVYYRGGR